MSSDATVNMRERKQQLRDEARERRKAQPEKDALSRTICHRLFELPAYQQAQTVMFYIDVHSEVRTRHDLPDVLTQGKRVVVPYCVEGEVLALFWLQSMDDLNVGMYKILEPAPQLRQLPERQVRPGELDLVVVPGVAFDRRGARMGQGKGYYDKLLENVRPETLLVAFAFASQLFDEIPVASHDIFMDLIITETEVIQGQGRQRGGGN